MIAADHPFEGPSLGLLELGSIARGLVVADAMVKQATVDLARAVAVSPGKFLTIVLGPEGEVSEAMARGREIAGEALVDQLLLARVDAQIGPALREVLRPVPVDAIAIVETVYVASAILAADRALKDAEVQLVRMRLANGLGGKAFFVLAGALHQIEAGIEAARGVVKEANLVTTEIIPRPHPDFLQVLWTS